MMWCANCVLMRGYPRVTRRRCWIGLARPRHEVWIAAHPNPLYNEVDYSPVKTRITRGLIVQTFQLMQSQIAPEFVTKRDFQYFAADEFPTIHPIHWLHSHFAVGGWSPLQRLSGMLTAHMTRIAPHNGFTWHPHRALEIYTWVLEGDLYHEDSTGGKGIIHAGEFQRMFAGDYIEHQELNVTDDPVRVIQIWFIADRRAQGLAAALPAA